MHRQITSQSWHLIRQKHYGPKGPFLCCTVLTSMCKTLSKAPLPFFICPVAITCLPIRFYSLWFMYCVTMKVQLTLTVVAVRKLQQVYQLEGATERQPVKPTFHLGLACALFSIFDTWDVLKPFCSFQGVSFPILLLNQLPAGPDFHLDSTFPMNIDQ